MNAIDLPAIPEKKPGLSGILIQKVTLSGARASITIVLIRRILEMTKLR